MTYTDKCYKLGIKNSFMLNNKSNKQKNPKFFYVSVVVILVQHVFYPCFCAKSGKIAL